MQYIAAGSAAVAAFVFTKNGVPTTPANAPTITAAYYNGALLSPLPATGSPTSPGVYTPTVFTAGQTAVAGYYFAIAYTADATMDNQISFEEWSVSAVVADSAGTTTLLARVPGVVQPQTGDSYARLGAPAGASIAADIAEIEAETDDIAAVKAKTDLLGASAATNIISPIATDGTITVYLSRDFNSADGLSIDIPVNVTLGVSDTIVWNAGPYGAYWLSGVACTRLSAGYARLQLTAANAAALNYGNTRYEVVVTPNGTTRKIEAAAGKLVVENVVVA